MGRVQKLGQHDPARGLRWHPGVKGLAWGLRSSKRNAATGPSRRDASPPPAPAAPPKPPASEAGLWGQLSWLLIPVPLNTCSRSCEHFHLSASPCPQHHMQCSPEGQDQGPVQSREHSPHGGHQFLLSVPTITRIHSFPFHASNQGFITSYLDHSAATSQVPPPPVEFLVKLTRWCKSQFPEPPRLTAFQVL